ncbi:PAS domain-containing sensor histidine kinase [Bacillus sp. V59.32b]|uniref:PAS domain-containing sensor histidine kinase n=1 Tax=Bacillus sp. V59.32b TaxID=1758642 RepID=UPI000E3C9B31|nr:PAS domain-containing sensor histidine kinase [Bacillus sp. V59.32b]RFU60413.1 PAS domain-containing sensor histidine kinase [Bacillus sp. V59.32b]
MVKSKLFAEVFYQSRIPQVIGDLEYRKPFYNQAFIEFLGYSAKELKNISMSDCSHPEDHEKDEKLFFELLEGKRKDYEVVKRYITKDGQVKTAILNVSYIRDPHTGNAYCLGQLIDLTEKLMIEQALRKEEEKYRLLAEHSSDIIALHEPDSTYLYISPSIKGILGCETEELLGRKPFEYIHPDDRDEVMKKYEKVVSDLVPMRGTYRCKKKDGEYIWLESSLKAVMDKETGQARELISISRDIQQRIETDELLRKSEKLAVIGQMAAAVAHEIRNPLTPIKGFLQLLSSGVENYNPAYTAIILNELNRIETIITEFLSMAKPHTEKMRVLKIEELVKQVVHLVRAGAHIHNKEIILEISAVPEVIGDENSLKQVFVNIIQNALEAIEVNGSVCVTLHTSQDFICIEVMDNGCGVPKELLPKLGEPFYSTKEKGTGLGLMTSYQIIENHKGKINIESEEGSGTKVSLMLPYVEVR